MPRRPYRKKARPSHPPPKRLSDEDALVQDTAGVFTCVTKTAEDFAYQCDSACDDLEGDLVYNRLAHEIWSGHPDRAPALIEALAELAAERQRHLDALTALGQRFDQLAADDRHDHLEPLQTYQELVRRRLFPPV
jgi:hypothetical protein